VSSIEILSISLGNSIVRKVAAIWLNIRGKATDATLSELVDNQVSDSLTRRRLVRELERLVDTVADRLSSVVEAEFRNLPAAERAAAMLAVSETLNRADLTKENLLAADFDPITLYRQVRRSSGSVDRLALSEPAAVLYDLLLKEACTEVAEIASSFSTRNNDAVTELLRRETDLVQRVEQLLSTLPVQDTSDPVQVFESSYRRALVSRLDHLELVGVALPPSTRRLPLSATYTDLNVKLRDRAMPVQWALVESSRLVLCGEAGSGKTTLLSWLAITAAKESLTGPLTRWNDMLPFYLPMREINSRPLPTPREFPGYLIPELAAEDVSSNVERRLANGRALLLVDGIDELSQEDRRRASAWLAELVDIYPETRVVVTSRPAAIPINWLQEAGFVSCEILPLERDSIHNLVRQWFLAIDRESEVHQALQYSDTLLANIESNASLENLASSPLMCTLLCAVSYTHQRLPSRQSELYRTFCETLLDRRDQERGIPGSYLISRADTLALLGDLALWMLMADTSNISLRDMKMRIDRTLHALFHASLDTSEVVRYLLERSGMLREPAPGYIQFIHESLQAYLAAREVIENGDVAALAARAVDDRWHDVIVSAAGEARAMQADTLLRGLLHEIRIDLTHRTSLSNLATECLANVKRLDPDLRQELLAAIDRLS
jgi:NACHT domain